MQAEYVMMMTMLNYVECREEKPLIGKLANHQLPSQLFIHSKRAANDTHGTRIDLKTEGIFVNQMCSHLQCHHDDNDNGMERRN
jgi:hypothetical protein